MSGNAPYTTLAANPTTPIPDEAIVHLNIGGHRFSTTAGTLLSKGENYFSALLSGRLPLARDECGAIFIDRNGRYFEPILDYLRTGSLALHFSMPWRMIAAEAEFYLLQGVLDFFRYGHAASLLVGGVADMDVANTEDRGEAMIEGARKPSFTVVGNRAGRNEKGSSGQLSSSRSFLPLASPSLLPLSPHHRFHLDARSSHSSGALFSALQPSTSTEAATGLVDINSPSNGSLIQSAGVASTVYDAALAGSSSERVSPPTSVQRSCTPPSSSDHLPPPFLAAAQSQLSHPSSSSRSPVPSVQVSFSDVADVVDLNANSLREGLLSRQANTREALTAFAACMRGVQRAASEGAVGVTLVLGEPEGAISRQGGPGLSYYRRYQRPRFVERLQVVTERELETLMASESGRETLFVLLSERGFSVRFLSVPCAVTLGPAANTDTTLHDGMLIYWGSVPLEQLLTATRKDVFSL